MCIITLTTDFGTEDWFVGTMKGVILGVNPQARVVDITHAVAPGDIRDGAFALAAACRFFPKGTVHLAVVDPGVGSGRSMIAVRTKNCFFVGPDNGLLSLALRRETVLAIHRLENRRYFLPSLSRTFQGRDIFAPVAAHLSRGVPLGRMGPRTSRYCRLDFPAAARRGRQLAGEIVYIDRFGNAITNIAAEQLRSQELNTAGAKTRNRTFALVEFYEAVRKSQPLALIGSTGYLELALNGGNAAKRLNLQVGDKVIVSPRAI